MNLRIVIFVLLAALVAACNHSHETNRNHEEHQHGKATEHHGAELVEEEHEHDADEHDGHEHEPGEHDADEHDADEHGHEVQKVQYTVYSDNYELFAEADVFVVGERANVLSHFSSLPNFRAEDSAHITLKLTVAGKVSQQTLDKPARTGIYRFDVEPQTAGVGSLLFEIVTAQGSYSLSVPQVQVFANHHEATNAAHGESPAMANTTVFTKEQSWKIDFATALPQQAPFGQVVKTTALVQPSQGKELQITASTAGIVVLTAQGLLEGQGVRAGQVLFSISGSQLANDNIAVRHAEAKSNFEAASANYQRAQALALDRIVSDKELQAAKNQYDNSKAVYDNLNRNFSATGQRVSSTIDGFVTQVLVKNGSYVAAGQPVVVVSQQKTLMLTADLPQRYAAVLGAIVSANIRYFNSPRTYTLEQLNGKVLSYGKAAHSDNFLLPVNLQIDNLGHFVSGSFVELYLKTHTNQQALLLPNTALLEEQGNFFVWVQHSPELFEKRLVHLGGTDGLLTELRSGLAPNERVVIRGAMMIKLAQATGSLDAHSGHVH